MEQFVQGLFQGSPDLSTLTHAIVQKKYLAHVGKENLTKEEKVQLKRLIEKELLQIQIEDSGDEESLTKLQPSTKSGGKKRTFCLSDSSEDEVEKKHEQKKRRTEKELELSSDEEDSGIDSKKAQVCLGPKYAGKSLSSPDHGDSGAEGHDDASGSEEESTKSNTTPLVCLSSKRRQGRGKGEQSGSESEESKGGKGSDVEEEVSTPRKATSGQTGESQDNSERDHQGRKLQKKKEMDREPGKVEKGPCRKKGAQSRERETDSEEEMKLSELRRKRRTDRSNSEKERVGGDGWKAKIAGGPRGRRAQEQSQSEDEPDCASGENPKMQRKVSGYKPRMKDASVEESESDSDESGGNGRTKKDARTTKSQRASAEELKSDSDVEEEEEEVMKKGVKKQGTRKAQVKRTSRKELGGNQNRRNPIKPQGGLKPARSLNRKPSGSAAGEEKGSGRKKKATRNSSSHESESQSEEDRKGKGKKPSEKIAVGSSDSESSSEETAGANQRQRKMSEERKANEEVSGSESSQEEDEAEKKGAEKPRRGSVSEVESESHSEDSGSESVGKVKNKSQWAKATPRPKGRSHKKEGMSESDEEEELRSSGEEDGSRPSKQGKDKGHRSTKGEDHPSVQRLKRYIWECGVRRNYKKLLMGCRSRKAQLEVLKQELENLGLKGTPTLAKCKALKKKREEAAEMASLDVSNIITTEGRPRRRNVWSLYSKPEEPPGSPEESPIRRPATDWSRLRGIISSDDESD
ncbi:HIRA-interacting protein 3 [Sphaerodactylus townsendi]|uniref:Uncharacterized protein n=1 Tax=Sphaerodactylus townsendi TaxID=933632 RepID=A0ACB8EW17_9SAUR|nr:HIRA-interacting protein 3 [Sphaerodactylus townsendi]